MPAGLVAITLFVEDLAAAKRFYSDNFQLPVHFEDDNSAVFKFGETLVNLLRASERPRLSRLPRSRLPTQVSGSNSRSASTTWTRWSTN